MPCFEVVFSKGIGFRFSPHLDDKANVRPAKPGELVEGTLVSDGQWLELSTGEGLFLPLRAPNGSELLRPVFEDSAGISKSGKSAPWQCGDEPPAFEVAPPAPQQASGRSDELAALDKKFDQKVSNRRPLPGRPSGSSRPGAVTHSSRNSPLGQMANSHDQHTAYMHEFRDALEDMGADTRNDPFLNRYAPVGGAIDAVHTRPGSASGSRPSSRSGSAGLAGRRMSGTPGGSGGADARLSAPSSQPRSGSGASSRSVSRPGSGGTSDALTMCGSVLISRSAASGTVGRWSDGPQNAIVPVQEWTSVKHGQEVRNRASSGRVIDVSDRNVLCMSVLGEKAILGSADHALKEVNIRAGQQLRNLYTKRFGHSEWVTSVSHCPDGRIVSGAQDSKVCLWNASGVSCVDMTGHLGAISRVRVDGQGKLAISASYDRTLGVWDLKAKRSVASCTGHNAPVLDFVWWDNIVASGDRSGVVKLWDTNHIACTGTLKGHKGHITAMLAVPDGDGIPTVVTGAQDGQLRVWDLRQKLNTHTMACHPGGAVNDLGITLRRDVPLLVSTGADGRVMILEPRAGYRPLHEIGGLTQDFLYSLLVLDNIAFVGDGRGQVTALDLDRGEKKYVLNAGENAIRCLGATSSSLICSGDDGNAVIFDF